jgi:hypothetical protein
MATIEAIATQRADSTILTMSFTSIPQTYQHLLVMASSKNFAWSQATLVGVLNDTSGPTYGTTGYFNNRLTFSSGGYSEVAGADNNYYYNVATDGIDTPAGCWSSSRWIIYDYANTNKNTSIMTMGGTGGRGSHLHTVGYNNDLRVAAGGWHENTAVTSLSLGGYSATNYGQMRGFTATLFGIKDS